MPYQTHFFLNRNRLIEKDCLSLSEYQYHKCWIGSDDTFLRIFHQRRPSVLQRLFISLYQTIHFFRLYKQNNKHELLVARCLSGFLLFLKMTQVSSCGFESLLRHYFLFMYIYILSLFCVSFHCSYFCFVSVNITSVNILINKIKVFV